LVEEEALHVVAAVEHVLGAGVGVGAGEVAVAMLVVDAMVISSSATSSSTRRHGEWGSLQLGAKCGKGRRGVEVRRGFELFSRSQASSPVPASSSLLIYLCFVFLGVQKRARIGARYDFFWSGIYKFLGAGVWRSRSIYNATRQFIMRMTYVLYCNTDLI
jgi:hypothetical protein